MELGALQIYLEISSKIQNEIHNVLELHSTWNKFTEGRGGLVSLGHSHMKGSYHLFSTYYVLDT